MLDHAGIAARIPHQGAMCLLDRVDEWSADAIACRAVSHRDAAHPLRAEGRLGAAAAIEYAAQAMALHGALVAAEGAGSGAPRAGYLASVRGAILHVDRLDDLAGDLLVSAQRLSGDDVLIVYRFELRHGTRCIAEGRASVVLDAAAAAAFGG